jgi:anti-sigma factor RsiW
MDAGAMSKCEELESLFAPYVEGASPLGERVAVEAHLERCPPCRDRVAGERAIRDVLVARRPGLRVCASAHLRAKCVAHAAPVRLPPVERRSTGFGVASLTPWRRQGRSMPQAVRAWLPLSLAATLVLAVAGAFVIGLYDQVEALAAQLTLDHVRCFQFAPERLTHVEPGEAGRAWAASQGWPLQIPGSSPASELELLGVRRCFMSGGRVAHVLYKWRGEPLSVFVVPKMMRRGQVNEIVEKFGHEAVVWSAGERTYVVLARAGPSELEPVLGYVRANVR